MASKSNLVNLDAMILREDFATEAEEEFSSDSFRSFSVKDFDLYSHVIKSLISKGKLTSGHLSKLPLLYLAMYQVI